MRMIWGKGVRLSLLTIFLAILNPVLMILILAELRKPKTPEAQQMDQILELLKQINQKLCQMDL